MGLRFTVAGGTIRGETLELQLSFTSLAGHGSVTLVTTQLGMCSFQRKTGLSMLKICQAVFAIMTGQTVRTVIRYVFQHKRRIIGGMAACTATSIQGKLGGKGMAGLAIHWQGIVVHLVPIQTEASLVMIEAIQAGKEGVKILSLVFTMTEIALVDLFDQAVRPRFGLNLLGDGCVTFQTELVLGGLQWGVAKAAFFFKAGVRGIAAKDTGRVSLVA